MDVCRRALFDRDLRPLGARSAGQRHPAPVGRPGRCRRDGHSLGRRAACSPRGDPLALADEAERLLARRSRGPRRRAAGAMPKRITGGTPCWIASSTSIAESSVVSLLVSIHDVTPALARRRRTPLGACARGAACARPCWSFPTGTASGRSGPTRPSSTWLRARAAEGAEIVLHGERHDEVGSPAPRATVPRIRPDRRRRRVPHAERAGGERADRHAADRSCGRSGSSPSGSCRRRGSRAKPASARSGRPGSPSARTTRDPPVSLGRRLRVTRGSLERPLGSRAWGSLAVARGRWTLQRARPIPAARLPSAGSRASGHRRRARPHAGSLARPAPADSLPARSALPA